MNKTIYVIITKRFLSGSVKGMVYSDVYEVANEQIAKNTVKDNPKDFIIGGGNLGPAAVILESSYIVE